MNIRDAAPADAAAACEVLPASISELCVADHHNDPEILKRWLASKTPDLAAWIADSEASTLLAVKDDVVDPAPFRQKLVKSNPEVGNVAVVEDRGLAHPWLLTLPVAVRARRPAPDAAIRRPS